MRWMHQQTEQLLFPPVEKRLSKHEWQLRFQLFAQHMLQGLATFGPKLGGNYWSCDEAGPGRAGLFYLLPWLVYCDSRCRLPLSLTSSTLRGQLSFATSGSYRSRCPALHATRSTYI